MARSRWVQSFEPNPSQKPKDENVVDKSMSRISIRQEQVLDRYWKGQDTFKLQSGTSIGLTLFA